jgi:predicted Rossmann fold nucleotide-binding protein DprA/Smf involved in DNA uptake
LQGANGNDEPRLKPVEDLVKENPLLQYISAESTSVNDIILGSQLTSAEVSSMLLELELIGAVTIANDGGYVNLS